MKNLYLLELSDVFAGQVYLPYSSGVVASYAFADEEVSKNYELKKWFYYRQDEEQIVQQIDTPDVIGFSCFVWNWNLNLDIAKSIKEKVDAVNCYKSQINNNTSRSIDAVKALAKFRGSQNGCDFAEAFKTVRVVI